MRIELKTVSQIPSAKNDDRSQVPHFRQGDYLVKSFFLQEDENLQDFESKLGEMSNQWQDCKLYVYYQ